MKKIFGLLFVAIMLVGCSGEEVTTTVCKASNYEEEFEETFTAEGDKLVKSVDVTKMDLSSYDFTDEYTDDEILEIVQSEDVYSIADYEGVDGIAIKESVKDGVYTLIITIDLEEVATDKLVELEIIEEGGYTSLEKTIEGYEEDGYTCKKQ